MWLHLHAFMHHSLPTIRIWGYFCFYTIRITCIMQIYMYKSFLYLWNIYFCVLIHHKNMNLPWKISPSWFRRTSVRVTFAWGQCCKRTFINTTEGDKVQSCFIIYIQQNFVSVLQSLMIWLRKRAVAHRKHPNKYQISEILHTQRERKYDVLVLSFQNIHFLH